MIYLTLSKRGIVNLVCVVQINQSYDTNVDKSVGNEKHSNDYKWQYPRRNAKNVVLQSELAPLPTSNRYIDLQLNEWTKEEISGTSENLCTKDSPRQTRKRRGNKQIVTIMGDSMVKDVQGFKDSKGFKISFNNHQTIIQTT